MLLLGYIISDTKYQDLSDETIQVVKNELDCKLQLPKLILGLDNAKNYAKEHNMPFDILDRTFPNGDRWSFKKTEKRDYYEHDLSEFKKHIIKSISNDINYYYINIYKLKYTKIKDLYNILFNNKFNRDINYIIIDNEMLYFPLCGNKVMGISFNHLRYIGIDREKVINKIKLHKSNKIYYTSSRNMWKLKDWFKGIEYVIPSILTNNIQKQS